MEQDIATPKALLEAVRYFADPDVSQDFFVKLRWPDGVRCPTCGSDAVTYLPNYRRWSCRTKHPKRQFSAKVGSIFEDSPLPLEKWLPATWLIANAKNGISSYEVARALSITQKSAWFMLHRIRLAMQAGSFEKMAGEVEVDETYIGGAARFMHKKKLKARRIGKRAIGKTAVMGLLERHGPDGHSRVRAQVVHETKTRTLDPEVRRQVEPGTTVYSDALPSYRKLEDEYQHQVIDHAESYVRGKVHTNGLENFWSLVKRALKGTYVSVEPFHLFRYLDEEAFRFNERRDPIGDGGRFVKVLRNATGRRLTHRQLTAEPA
jgi:transposase-like protein